MCGIKLPDGLRESEKLPEPIYTPSTKGEIGEHDENISFDESINVIEKEFSGKGVEYASKLRDYTIELYEKCAEYARRRGIIIADTKFEFGLDENGKRTQTLMGYTVEFFHYDSPDYRRNNLQQSVAHIGCRT